MPTTDPAAARVAAGRPSLVLALALVAAGCGVADASPSHQAPATAPNPFIGATAPSAPQQLAGRVEERLVAGSYVYLAVRDRDGALRWAVVLGDAPPLGADVALTSTARRTDFHSPRLGRDFAELHFAVLR
ncbi:hypothetical protein SAMN02745121_05340 [Nannocystis exedens]|uniref:Lipoprotein n=1 Tax=Nannocystis exedens TaxID=54 RepID=A0A1I2CYR6_9BACT|nr:hypothetical protein [Nannocystis exedens]PCC68664.1 hypothetical protein NAEX_01681 [Nannocystis exedens]SFE73365.1 hypothetical protein SAMN02745121_05340 [Nannocystis exedens]